MSRFRSRTAWFTTRISLTKRPNKSPQKSLRRQHAQRLEVRVPRAHPDRSPISALLPVANSLFRLVLSTELDAVAPNPPLWQSNRGLPQYDRAGDEPWQGIANPTHAAPHLARLPR